MVSMRRYGTCTAYLALAFSIGCSVGSETEQPTGQVRLEQTKSVLLAVAVPGQSATLDIWGVQTGIPMAVDTDGSVTATVPNVPAGLRTFQINYRSGGIGPNSFLVAQAGASATVGADTTTPVTLTAVHREFDDDGDGTSNFNEAFAGTNPTDPGSGGTPGATVPAIGDSHTCTVLAGGSVRCWGSNLVGELGNGTTVSASSPVVVTGVAGATTVAAGSIFSCARIANGTVQCWGFNQFGQLGDGTTTDRVTAVNVTGITSATQVASGADSHSCARLVDGTVRCWGKNNFGQLGNGTTINSSSPVEVLGINNAISVTTGFNYSCAALADGTVRCWGRNDVGQLGNGSTSNSAVPVAVSGITTAAAVAGGGGHSCARLIDFTVQCWGKNDVGQLGNGTTSNSFVPVVVTGISSATSVGVGTLHSCARLADGTVRCWGHSDDGKLGNGSTTNATTPVVVSGISTATIVVSGGGHSCARLADGTMRCWGWNTSGQIGNGTVSAAVPTPVQVSGIP